MKSKNEAIKICYFCNKSISDKEIGNEEAVLMDCPNGTRHYCHISHHGVKSKIKRKQEDGRR